MAHEWDAAAQVVEIEALLRDGGWDGDDVVAGVKGLINHAELLRAVQRDLLGQALGRLLVAIGAVVNTDMTGPELLFHAEQTARDFEVGFVKVVAAG
jgi:hypothetical protein